MDIWGFTHRAHEDTGKIIATLGEGDWGRPTPCTEWTAGEVVRHLVDNNKRYAALAAERDRTPVPPLDARLPEAFLDSSAEFLKAFDAEARKKTLDFGIFGSLPGGYAMGVLFVDVLVHGWDLDTAMGREHHWDDELVTVALSIASKYPNAAPVRGPGGAFAEAVAPVGDAAPGDRLVALLGRDPRRIIVGG
jgi:uncharacterized protein (TIGR03086 family)